MKTITEKQQRRRYRIYHNLKKKGNTTAPRGRTVTKRARIVSDIEQQWLCELIDAGYCVCDPMFENV